MRKLYPVTPHLDGQKFVTVWQGRKALTPLALVLVMVETTDLIFALDSIPAIFAVTTKPFIVFTSNVFAILGLRSLYFVLAGALGLFPLPESRACRWCWSSSASRCCSTRTTSPPRWFQVDIPISVSLLVVGGIILISIVLSITAGRRKQRSAGQ